MGLIEMAKDTLLGKLTCRLHSLAFYGMHRSMTCGWKEEPGNEAI